MESVAIATTSRSLPIPFPSAAPRRRRRASLLSVAAAAKRRDDEGDEAARGPRTSSGGGGAGHREPTSLAPYGLSVSPFSKDAAMGLVMSAATGSGWTTGSGMEGPPTAGGMDRPEVSTLPWSLFTKSPRRRMRVAFTCNVCGQRTTRAINPHAYTDGTVFVQDFVHSLGIQKRLRNHKGAVNSISFNGSGSLLLPASDDETAMLWNLAEPASALKFHTGHGNDVLDAQFMPLSDDQSIVTCGADAEVRRSRIQEGGCVSTDKLADLRYVVTQLAVRPGSHTFFSCVEDGSVWHFDLREKRPRKLFKCGAVRSFDYLSGDTMQLYAIALDPRYPSCFAVSGDDEYVRLYDARKIDLERSKFGIPFEQFCPPDLICNKRDGIAGLAFSQTGELLASYHHDNIYLFSREHGLHFNDFCGIAVEKLPLPRTFKGHENKQDIKGVSFLGPNCDYVTSGSDCGNIFIWRKKDGELIRVMKGDKRIVNCVKQHPTEIVVASCGIDADVKIWAPGDNENPSTTRFDEVDSNPSLVRSTGSDSDCSAYVLSARFDSSSNYFDDDDETDGDEDQKDDEWRYMTAK